MKDRVPLYPGRVKLVPVAGQSNVYDMERADQPTEAGTPLNKASLLKDTTAAALGLSGATATPDDAFQVVGELKQRCGQVKDLSGEFGRVAVDWKVVTGIGIENIVPSNYNRVENERYFLFGNNENELHIVDKATLQDRVLSNIPCAQLSIPLNGTGVWGLNGTNLVYVDMASGSILKRYTLSKSIRAYAMLAYDSSMVVIESTDNLLHPVRNGAIGTSVKGGLTYGAAIIGNKLYCVYEASGLHLMRAVLSAANTIKVEEDVTFRETGNWNPNITGLFSGSEAYVFVRSAQEFSSGTKTYFQFYRYPLSIFTTPTWTASQNFSGSVSPKILCDVNSFYVFLHGSNEVYQYSRATGVKTATLSVATPPNWCDICNPPGKILWSGAREILPVRVKEGFLTNTRDILYDVGSWKGMGIKALGIAGAEMTPELCTSDGTILLREGSTCQLAHVDMNRIAGFYGGGEG